MDWSSCLSKPNGVTLSGPGVASLSCVPIFAQTLIRAALDFAGIVAVFFIIWGGFKYIRSAGDPKQADGARQTITYAIIGLIIIFLSYFIISLIAQVTGVKCIKNFGFDNCVPAATSSISHEGQYGCFANKDGDPAISPICAAYSPENDPKEPINGTWYQDDQCSGSCQ